MNHERGRMMQIGRGRPKDVQGAVPIRHRECRAARPIGAAMTAAFLLAACTGALDSGVDHSPVCVARGLTPGTDSFLRCVEQEEWRTQEEFRQIRHAREAGRSDRM
jgi:hypothetical protein